MEPCGCQKTTVNDGSTVPICEECGTAMVESEVKESWGIYDRSITAIAIKAIQEQQVMIDELKAKVAALENP